MILSLCRHYFLFSFWLLLLLFPSFLNCNLKATQYSCSSCWSVLLNNHLCNGLGGFDLLLLLLFVGHGLEEVTHSN